MARKPQRQYAYKPKATKRRHQARALFVLLVCVLAYSLTQLIGYGRDLRAAQTASEELRALYHQAADQPTATATASPAPTATPPISPTPPPEATAAPAPTVQTHLASQPYPGNPNGHITSRFQSIRRQNEDIVGWLTIEGMLDEAVVQRDNTYYLRRDYRGYHNVNGALFLDESISLNTRPHTLTIYGHNMKTGAMFGDLRNYQSLYFYQQNPFITFNTMYEDGRYVIFSITELSLDPASARFFQFGSVHSDSIPHRQQAINVLQDRSIFSTPIDVRPADQLLLLVTCVDNAADRRIIAARRLRDGETEASLQAQINDSHAW